MQAALFTAQAFRHHGYAANPLLSVKCMFNGRAVYNVGRLRFAVDETGYLILNDGQAYEIEIDSPTRVESFVVYFPRQWAADTLRGLVTPLDKLLEVPAGEREQSVHFFERFTPHDEIVSPELRRLRRAYRKGPMPDTELEERLRKLLACMLRTQCGHRGEIERLNAVRSSTREELWRRLNRAQDFIRARLESPMSLGEMAEVACLSSFHFLRAFKTAFAQTPHQFLTACRGERAKFLLERTDIPVTEICAAVGFESLGTFSSWFQRYSGSSPRAWRKRARSKK
jgi:AraC family transcriptional regulator